MKYIYMTNIYDIYIYSSYIFIHMYVCIFIYMYPFNQNIQACKCITGFVDAIKNVYLHCHRYRFM